MPQIDVTQPDPDLVPPYAGRTTGADDGVGDALKGSVERQLDETKTGRPGATSSPADESPVAPGDVDRGAAAGAGDQTATSTDASTPEGVGTSTTRRGEDVSDEEQEAGRQRTGTQGPTDRPVGTSTSRDTTGIDPQ